MPKNQKKSEMAVLRVPRITVCGLLKIPVPTTCQWQLGNKLRVGRRTYHAVDNKTSDIEQAEAEMLGGRLGHNPIRVGGIFDNLIKEGGLA
jgi:hypothetical protein